MRAHQGSSSAVSTRPADRAGQQPLYQAHAGAERDAGEGTADADQRGPEHNAAELLVLGCDQRRAQQPVGAAEQPRTELNDGLHHRILPANAAAPGAQTSSIGTRWLTPHSSS
jgi:hypothetical protein